MDNNLGNNYLKNIERITRDISDGLMLIDQDGTIAYVDPSGIRLLGNPAIQEGAK